MNSNVRKKIISMYHNVIDGQKQTRQNCNKSLALRLVKDQSIDREFKVNEKKKDQKHTTPGQQSDEKNSESESEFESSEEESENENGKLDAESDDESFEFDKSIKADSAKEKHTVVKTKQKVTKVRDLLRQSQESFMAQNSKNLEKMFELEVPS